MLFCYEIGSSSKMKIRVKYCYELNGIVFINSSSVYYFMNSMDSFIRSEISHTTKENRSAALLYSSSE